MHLAGGSWPSKRIFALNIVQTNYNVKYMSVNGHPTSGNLFLY